VFARPATVSAGLKMRKAPVAAVEAKKAAPPRGVSQQKALMAAMPQLIPFYFVNEVVAGYAAILVVCYLLTKYWLPQTVRSRLARLFVSKL